MFSWKVQRFNNGPIKGKNPLKIFFGRDVPLGKWKLTHTFTKFWPKIGPIHLPKIKNLPRFWEFLAKFVLHFRKCWRFFRKFRENRLLKKITTHWFTKIKVWEGGHSFTRGVKMGPYSAAHPNTPFYLSSPPGRPTEVRPCLFTASSKTVLTNVFYVSS